MRTLLEHLLYSHLPNPRLLRRVVAKTGRALPHRCRTRRAVAQSKVLRGALWKGEMENVLMPMLEKYEVVLVEDPEGLIHW